MPYRVLSKKEREVEEWRQRDLPKAIKGIVAAQKLGLARKKQRRSHKINIRIAESNAHSYLQHSMNLELKIGAVYAFCRMKIQDPSTPRGRKKAFRQVCEIMEMQLGGREALCRDNPLIRRHVPMWVFESHTPEALKFCWVRPRIG